LLSIFLWFHVVTDKVYETAFRVPIELVNTPEGLVIAGAKPDQGVVKLTGSGKQLLLAKLKSSSLRIRISIAGGKLGNNSYVVLPTDVELPDGIYVNGVDIVEPAEVEVRLDALMEKKVKVVPRVAIDLAPMHIQVGPVSLRPDSVLVRGPRSYVRGISVAKLEPLELSNVESQVKRIVPISVDRPGVTYIPGRVEVTVDIQEIAERHISDVPVKLRGFPPGLRLVPTPPRAELKVLGGAELLASLEADDFGVYIDYGAYLRAREGGTGEVKPVFELPPGVKLLRSIPEKFTLIRSFTIGPAE